VILGARHTTSESPVTKRSGEERCEMDMSTITSTSHALALMSCPSYILHASHYHYTQHIHHGLPQNLQHSIFDFSYQVAALQSSQMPQPRGIPAWCNNNHPPASDSTSASDSHRASTSDAERESLIPYFSPFESASSSSNDDDSEDNRSEDSESENNGPGVNSACWHCHTELS